MNVDKDHPNDDIIKHNQMWKENNQHVSEWIDYLNYILIILKFLGEYLKEREATIGWWIIVITTLISFITLFDLEKLGTDTSFNSYYQWGKSVALSGLSITTTLLAAWSKKNNLSRELKKLIKE